VSTEHILLIAAAIIVLSVFASKAVSRLALPALAVFLAIGMLAGSEGLGGIAFDDAMVAQFIGVVALVFIIFAGGLHSDVSSIRPVLRAGAVLSTAGVLITAAMVAFLTYCFLGIPLKFSFLIGAIVSSTDAAAVFSVLGSRNIKLKGNLGPLLEFESASNDPIAVLLTIGVIHVIMGAEVSSAKFILYFLEQIGIGVASGYFLGKLTLFMLRKFKLDYKGLYAPLLASVVLLIYAATALVGGSGFLAIYIVGLILAHNDFPRKEGLKEFHDGLGWLMQIIMFVLLGLLVFPSRLLVIAYPAMVISAVLIFIARPVGVFLPMAFIKGFNTREKIFISWVGLRGSVPIVLATFPMLAGVPYSKLVFNVIFFIVLTSVLLQATSIGLVARLLKLQQRSPD